MRVCGLSDWLGKGTAMKRILVAFIAALIAAASLSGCFVVERDHHDRDRYEHHDRYDHDRGYNHYNGF
jgi:hypothetical protein